MSKDKKKTEERLSEKLRKALAGYKRNRTLDQVWRELRGLKKESK